MTDRRIGCAVVQHRPIDELRRDWTLLEEAGVDSLWVFDHLMAFPKMGVLLEAWTTLAAMAEATSRVRIGPLVTNITYRNPAVLAKEAISVDHISGGRLDLGIGAAGSRIDDSLIPGVEEWPTSERVERFGEFVAMVSALTSGAQESYAGAHYRSEHFSRGPWPVRDRIPLTIAAHGRKTLRVVAQYADTWSVAAGYGRLADGLTEFLRDYNARLDDLANEVGRDPRAIRRSLLAGPGLDWWKSEEGFADFVGSVAEAGTHDLVFQYPLLTKAKSPPLLDLIASLL